ncbi:hypothetical protein NA57DRAFT_76816 [Rhizodiscina lignyota]|uniref:N-acetyltransferase domain-containing protein n=1 Tax=Rhizodiscina lignyota TaxID=1504668 RepID=A0A9P4IE65_9PEZI|nr:hypothetical protein NA57DRAFT_76816 [Rhizodiscina lignyota]
MQTSIATWLKKPRAVTQPQDDQELQSTKPQAPTIEERHVAPAVTPESPAGVPHNHSAQENHNTSKPFAFRKHSHPLPANVIFSPLTPDLVPSYRRLNSLLLPISYQDKFYTETLEDPIISSLTLIALWQDSPPTTTSTSRLSVASKPRLVAAIRCRLLSPPSPTSGPSLYLSTIGTLAPFRSHGLASHLLENTIYKAVDIYGIGSVTAHVWAANTEALEWYSKRGFKEVDREQYYYRRLNPSEAVLMRRDISVLDALPMDTAAVGNGG